MKKNIEILKIKNNEREKAYKKKQKQSKHNEATWVGRSFSKILPNQKNTCIIGDQFIILNSFFSNFLLIQMES